MMKRTIALVLSLLLLISAVPMQALAQSIDGSASDQTAEVLPEEIPAEEAEPVALAEAGCEHVPDEWGAYENEIYATCTEDGSYDYVIYCTVCGQELSRETVVSPAYGHYASGAAQDGMLSCDYCGELFSADMYPEGSVNNPAALRMGENSVTVEENGTGCFRWTADEAGTLSVTMTDAHWVCTIYGEDGNYVALDSLMNLGNTLTMSVSAGENMWVYVSTLDPDDYTYPAGTVTFTTAFTAQDDPGSQPTEPEAGCAHVPEKSGEWENIVMPSCTVDGSYDNVFYCELCGEELSREFTVWAALGHVLGRDAGDGSAYCTECSAVYQPGDYPVGSQSNPEWIVLGENSITTTEASTCGFLAWTAPAAGNFKITMTGSNWSVKLYSLDPSTHKQLRSAYLEEEYEEGNTVVLPVSEGELVRAEMYLYYYPDGGYISESFAGTIPFTASFTVKEEEKPPEEENVLSSGSCGENATWKLYLDGLLVIDGSGPMYDYEGAEEVPWYEYSQAVGVSQENVIKNIVVNPGITTIGPYAFSRCESLRTVELPDGLTNIGDYAFYYCYYLERITIPASVNVIGEQAFCSCYYLEWIRFDGNAPSISDNAFSDFSTNVGYPMGNETWTEDCFREYGSDNIWWLPYCGCTDGVFVEAKDPTCIEDGYEQDFWYCERHDVAFSDEEMKYPFDYDYNLRQKSEYRHELSAWEVRVEATKDSAGTLFRACIYCGQEETKPYYYLAMGENIAQVEADDQEGVPFVWTAETEGDLIIAMPEGDWCYVITNITSGERIAAYSDDYYVDNPVTMEVSSGDEVKVEIRTYDPEDYWNKPAGTIIFEAEFVPDQLTGDYTLGTPRNLQWHKEYDWVLNEETMGYEQALVDHAGYISWKPGSPDQKFVELVVYKDGIECYRGYRSFGYEDRAEYVSLNLDDDVALESGEYYFTVQSIPDYSDPNFDPMNAAKPSEIAVSDTWVYVKPEMQKPTVANPRWEGDMTACWDALEGDGNTYEVEFLFAPNTGSEPHSIGTNWVENGKTGTQLWGGNYEDAIEMYGAGYYYFRVRLLSEDIREICHGEWSALSQAWVTEGASRETVEISGNATQLMGGQSTKLTAKVLPDGGKVIWYLVPGDEAYASLKANGNTVTVTAAEVTEPCTVTVVAVTASGSASSSYELTILPQLQELRLYMLQYTENGEQKLYLNEGEERIYELTGENSGVQTFLFAECYPASAQCQVTWSSSNTKVVTVSQEGVVSYTGKSGTAVITADAGNGVKATVSFKVIGPAPEVEAVGETRLELMGGQSTTLKVRNAETKKAITGKNVQWSLWMEDGDVSAYASINSSGKLTTKKVMEQVSFEVYAFVAHEGIFSRNVRYQVTLYPAATHVELLQEGDRVNDKTILFDLNTDSALTLDVQVLPEDAMDVVPAWKASDSKNAYAEYSYDPENHCIVIENPTGKTGTVTLTVTAQDGSKKKAVVKVQFARAAQQVQILHEEIELLSGKTLTLQAQVAPEDVTKSGVTWSLADPADKAYVTLSGNKLKAKTVYFHRTVTLIATSKDGEASASCQVTILPKDPDALTILRSDTGENVTKATVLVDLNEKDRDVYLQAKNLSDGSDAEVTWTVKGKNADYSVTEGKLWVYLQKAGSVTVTAKSGTRSATVTLKAVKLANEITLTTKNGKEPVVASGKTLDLKATVSGGTGKKVTWSIREGSEYAKINTSGKLTAAKNLAAGQEVVVRATAADGSGIYAELTVQVKPLATGIQIYTLAEDLQQRTVNLYNSGGKVNRSNTTFLWDMENSGSFALYATVYPFYGKDAAGSALQDVTWKSSSAKVATVDANGLVTCLKPGTTTITAAAADGSGQKISFKLTVVKTMQSLTLADTAVVGGKSISLKPIIEPADTTNKSLKWEILEGSAYATIDRKGKLTARKVTQVQTVRVAVSSQDGSGLAAECLVQIWPKAVSKVELLREGEKVTGKTVTLKVGESITLTNQNTADDACQEVTWKSANEDFVSVEDGVITAQKAGKTVTITCTAADGSNKKATVKIKVVN